MEKKSILIADDDRGVTDLLSDIFREKGFTVYKAYDGGMALEVYHQHRPHIALLDIDMPNRDGLEVTKSIRQIDNFIPIIILTGFRILEQDSLECYGAGATLFLRKPVRFEEIYACINSLMSRVYDFPEKIKISNYEMNIKSHVLTCGTFESKLTEREAKMLRLLYKCKNKMVTLSELSNYVLRSGIDNNRIQMLRNIVSKLKIKLYLDPAISIESWYGKGYILYISDNKK